MKHACEKNLYFGHLAATKTSLHVDAKNNLPSQANVNTPHVKASTCHSLGLASIASRIKSSCRGSVFYCVAGSPMTEPNYVESSRGYGFFALY